MKKIGILLFCMSFFLVSCSSDDDFVDTDTIGVAFEVTANFNESNDYRESYIIDPPLISGDMVLIYRRDPQQTADVWELLPTANFFFFNEEGAINGFINYRYEFSPSNYDIILEFDTPEPIATSFTNNQLFRVVIVPSDLVQSFNSDFKDINEVLSKLSINESDIENIRL